jgi:hypothetical protein
MRLHFALMELAGTNSYRDSACGGRKRERKMP